MTPGGLATLIESAAGAGTATATDRTTARILDAAVTEAASVGINRITVEDVVRRAGVSRMTAYRRYPRRDDLIEALVHRETHRFLAAVSAGIAAAPAPGEAVVEAYVAAVAFARGHPMLRRAAHTDSALPGPETVALLEMGRSFIAAHINTGSATPDQPPSQQVRWVADVFARLFLTYLSAPPRDPDFDDEAQVRRFANEILTPMVAQALSGQPLS